ncbi:response regulator [Lignipirellula cremea]|uniref:Sensory/regulatory protein RpfC n=1 Tax=Lignipirellula cremea TaxID=2528010 RepID=A0A518DRH6_9BACT|nr:response regulator [Lignipirellula cremea]QDU94439.1 Signal transduction histidine-protein kinase BarA [Lignipirellula cremea]
MRKIWINFGVPFLAVLAAWLVTLILSPWDGGHRPFIVLSAAVLVSAWSGGLVSGLMALGMAIVVGSIQLYEPRADTAAIIPDVVHLALFVFQGLLISVICATLRSTRQNAIDAQQQAEDAFQQSQVTVGHLQRVRDDLRTTEGRLTRLVEANIIGVYVGDYEGGIQMANERFLEMTGWEAQSLSEGKLNWRAMTPPEFEACDSAALEELERLGRCQPYEKELRTRSGERIPVLLGAAEFQDQLICFALDLSEQKKTSDELRQAKQRAEESNRAKSEFLANTSHELRTPMNAIIGMTSLALQEEDLSPLVRDYLETVEESADLLLRLLNDVLDFSKIEAGKLELEDAEFEVAEVFSDTVKAHSIAAAEKGLELVCRVHADVPRLLIGDSARLKQMASNLVSNSIKFTEQGEVVVRVHVKSETKTKVLLHVTVTDTGIGISSDAQKKIFAPFTQADSSTTRRFGGTGLGLSIVAEVATLMGGRTWLESTLGSGSRFHFTCALRKAPEETPKFPTMTRNLLARLYELPMLVVDDNPSHLEIMGETLASWSIRPELASSAAIAMELLEQKAAAGEQFAVVFVDALMPEVDGFTLIDRIVKNPRFSAKTILMLSSADRQTFAGRLAACPATGFLDKPIAQSNLLDAIVTALDGRDSRQVSPDASDDLGRTTSERPMRVLVVEDTPANQKVVRAILARRGHAIEIAQNGREAIDQVKSNDYDVVLMDVQMPTMDGFQATEAIRQMSRRDKASIPIVAMTAHAMQGDRERCLAAGMDGYISKPLNAQHLLETVESFGRRLRSDPTETSNGDSHILVRTPHEETMSDADEVAINLDAAMVRLGNDRTLLNEMIGFYLDDAPELMARIELGLQQADAASIERAAHSLKGLSANFDAVAVSQSSFQIERMASSQELQSAKSVLPVLKRQVSQLMERLQQEIGR